MINKYLTSYVWELNDFFYWWTKSCLIRHKECDISFENANIHINSKYRTTQFTSYTP